MSLFVVQHVHEAEKCPAGDAEMGPMLLKIISDQNASNYGVTVKSEAVLDGRHTLYMTVDAEDEGVEDERAGEDDAGLEAAAGPEIAVELHIQREQHDRRDQGLGDDPQDGLEYHCAAFFLSAGWRFFLGLRERPIRIRTPTAAVKMTPTSPRVS